jgi:hypothetical protein
MPLWPETCGRDQIEDGWGYTIDPNRIGNSCHGCLLPINTLDENGLVGKAPHPTVAAADAVAVTMLSLSSGAEKS